MAQNHAMSRSDDGRVKNGESTDRPVIAAFRRFGDVVNTRQSACKVQDAAPPMRPCL